MEQHNLSLTTLETQVLESIIENLYAEPGFSDIDASDLSCETGISTRSIRGVLSSLVQKNIIHIDDLFGTGHQIVYLTPSHWYLHPEWKDAV